jgi:hypothetical protein
MTMEKRFLLAALFPETRSGNAVVVDELADGEMETVKVC